MTQESICTGNTGNQNQNVKEAERLSVTDGARSSDRQQDILCWSEAQWGQPPPPPPAGCPLEAEVVQRRRLLVFRTQKKKGKRGKGSWRERLVVWGRPEALCLSLPLSLSLWGVRVMLMDDTSRLATTTHTHTLTHMLSTSSYISVVLLICSMWPWMIRQVEAPRWNETHPFPLSAICHCNDLRGHGEEKDPIEMDPWTSQLCSGLMPWPASPPGTVCSG